MLPTREDFYSTLEKRHGKKLQKKLSEVSVAVCGLGGLGSNIAVCLARMGVGRLHLIDFDEVELSNINRQQYFLSQTGQPKTSAIKEIINRINPFCMLVIHNTKLCRENYAELLKDDDIICEAFDRAESKAELVDFVTENLPGKYIIASSGMSGCHTANIIKTRKISEKLYICGDFENSVEKDGTLFASRVMVCAAHQANAVVEILKGETNE